MKVAASDVKSGGLGGNDCLEGHSSSGRKPLSPSDTSIDESVKSAQHAGKEVRGQIL
jgi:hypothetical protein